MRFIKNLHQSPVALIILMVYGLFSTSHANIDYLFIFKEQAFQQVDNVPPDTPLFWFANAGVSGDNQVTGGTVVYPGSGGPETLTGGDGNYSTDSDDYLTQAAMDAAYPNGEVTLSIVENGSTTDYGPFTITGDNYPVAPHFLNLEELGEHDGSQDFLIQWNSFTGAEANDKIVFQIFEPELEEEVMFEVLPAGTTEITIPGGSLQEFFGYDMELFFLKSTDGLETPETLIGYISSVYTNASVGSFSDVVDIPDEAVARAVREELFIPDGDPISFAEISELFSLTVTSDGPIDLTGLNNASGLSQLTLNTDQMLSFLPVLNLDTLGDVKLIAPQKEGLFFTHWSDGNRKNPRLLDLSGFEDFGLQAQYSTTPLSPFAGGYSLVVNGVVTQIANLPIQLDVEVGDPYELRFNYLIREEATLYASDASLAALDYAESGLLPAIGMEAELVIGEFRWVLGTTNSGIDQAALLATSFAGTELLELVISDTDERTEYDFPFSNGIEQITLLLGNDVLADNLFNDSVKIPESTDDVNWQAITSGSIVISSISPTTPQTWSIILSLPPEPGQSYRIERLPSFLDSSQRIAGYSTNPPSAQPGNSTDHIAIDWADPHFFSFETTYEVWRGVSNHLPGASLVADNITDTPYIDRGVMPGRNYYYWIRAIRDGLKADFSASVSSFRAIAIPEDIQATQGDFSDRIRVSWTRVSGANSYSVYRSVTDDVNTAELLTTGIINTEYEDLTPDTDDPYYYWVTSKAFGTTSDFSESTSGYRVANGITTVRASDGLYNDRVEITWEAFPGAGSYTIYRSTVSDNRSATVLIMDVVETQYDDLIEAGNQGITYYYWVRPLTGAELGSFSNTDSGYIPVQRNTKVLAWGDNDFDQTNIPDANLLDIVAIAAGANHSLALDADGKVVGWGRNEFGQASPPFGLRDVIDIAVGYDHSLALKSDGTVVAWGRNSFGKATVPSDLVNVIDIQTGAEHSLALLSDGSVVGWGSNDFGQINIPPSLTQVVQISAGGYHNLARRADGTVVTWGDNRFGQLEIPGSISQVIDIAAGWNHNLVLLPNGTVDGWGDNSRGQLDFPSDIQEPPQAKGVVIREPVTARIVDISGGLFHSLALSEKGELSAWGEEKNSQTENPQNQGTVSQIDAGDEFNLIVQESPLPEIESLIPGDTDLLAGEDIVLRVRATGGPDITYQWFFNDQMIDGATSDALLLSEVSLDEQGPYRVKAFSGGNEVSSESILIEVTLNQATIASQTVRAIRTYNGEYLFSPIETNPPGLQLAIRSSESTVLPSTPGTHMVAIDVDQKGYTATPVENVTLILETLNEKPLRLIDAEPGMTIQYLAPEGFSSTLQTSSDMRDWTTLAKVAIGDGQLKDFLLTSAAETFYRVVFDVPETN